MNLKLDNLVKYLPYSNMFTDSSFEEVVDQKFKIMSQSNLSREDKIQRLSVVNQNDFNHYIGSGFKALRNDSYSKLIYSGIMENKIGRINSYRELSMSPKLYRALTEICDEFVSKDTKMGTVIKFQLKGDYDDETKEIIKKEFYDFVEIFDIEGKGYSMCWDFLIEGEVFYENIISVKNPEKGILGVNRIDATRIDPVYFDKENDMLSHFILRKKANFKDENINTIHNTNNGQTNQALILAKNQITYIHSPEWDQKRLFRVPHIEKARRTHKRFELVEDSAVIYTMNRAPERLVFGISMGSMTDPKKVEMTMNQHIARLNAKKTMGSNGRMENTMDPQHLTENYYLPQFQNGANSTITSLPGGQGIPAIMEILDNFKKDIYNDLRIPILRLNPESGATDGTEITREELRFAKFIMRIQGFFAKAIKRTFITHLKLKGKKLAYLSKSFGIPVSENIDSFWADYDKTDAIILEHLEKLKLEKLIALEECKFQIETIRERKYELKTTIVEDIGNIQVIELEINNLEDVETDLLTKVTDLKKEIDDYNAFHQSYWEKYELRESDIDISFNDPTAWRELRSQQFFQIKVDNLNNLAQNPGMSYSYLLKTEMGWTDEQIKANAKWREYDAKRAWVVNQIESAGPDFRSVAAQQAQAAISGGNATGPGLDAMAGGGGLGAGENGPGNLADLKAPDLGSSGNAPSNPEAGGQGSEATPIQAGATKV